MVVDNSRDCVGNIMLMLMGIVVVVVVFVVDSWYYRCGWWWCSPLACWWLWWLWWWCGWVSVVVLVGFFGHTSERSLVFGFLCCCCDIWTVLASAIKTAPFPLFVSSGGGGIFWPPPLVTRLESLTRWACSIIWICDTESLQLYAILTGMDNMRDIWEDDLEFAVAVWDSCSIRSLLFLVVLLVVEDSYRFRVLLVRWRFCCCCCCCWSWSIWLVILVSCELPAPPAAAWWGWGLVHELLLGVIGIIRNLTNPTFESVSHTLILLYSK